MCSRTILFAALCAVGSAGFAAERDDSARSRAQWFDREAGVLLERAIASESANAPVDSFLALSQSRGVVSDPIQSVRAALGLHGDPVYAPTGAMSKGAGAIAGDHGSDWVGIIRPVAQYATDDSPPVEWVHAIKPVNVVVVGPIAPVPEPSTWALMLAGLGCVALRAVHRRRGR